MSDSDTVISVESLSKRYFVGHEGPQERYHSLRDTVVRHGKNFLRKTVDMAKGKLIIQGDTVEEFSALKDVSFEVKRGDVLGIIGRNGAGKSTLLKILSRITEPTDGRVVLTGRVASLLEVGTGFHPELSGRENIFLNGAILGMSRAEIKSKFDEIVEFADVEKFLDTPVKRYSSGMYVRLAFAVAAHLEPEILIIDEVLAVGDAEFQRKCLGKIGEVAKGGRTVIFVSHNMAAVRALCARVLVMKSGRMDFDGATELGILSYLTPNRTILAARRTSKPSGEPTITFASISVVDSKVTPSVVVNVEITSARSYLASLEVRLFDQYGAPCGLASSGLTDPSNPLAIHPGTGHYRLRFDCSRLARGDYHARVRISIPLTTLLDEFGDDLDFKINHPSLPNSQRPMEQAWGFGACHFDSDIDELDNAIEDDSCIS
jgi:lipopolysaccharide transport system ATP-binding protein